MSIDTSNQQSFSATFTAAMKNPWAYLVAAATSMEEIYKLLGKPIDDAVKLAADIESGLLSRAAQQQRAAQVFLRNYID